jgi:hypothetical protein
MSGVADERALAGASDVEPALERRADVTQRRLAGPTAPISRP